MAGVSVLQGEIPDEGIVPVLQEVERRSISGVIRFRAGDASGEVAIACGELVSDQAPSDGGEDPVELLLGLQEGRYEVLQRLPPLPVSRGDARVREGSLAVHVPADLMNYCERAGLTGALILEQEDRRAEILYDGGELAGIQLDGTDDDDLNEVFGWQEGRFRVEAMSSAPRLDDSGADAEEDPQQDLPTTKLPRVDEGSAQEVIDDLDTRKTIRRRRMSTGQHFLRVVEMELGRIVTDRENHRPASRTSPPLPPKSETKRPGSLPPPSAEPRRPRNPTVKVIYLGARQAEPSETGRTRHVYREVSGEGDLPDAAPARVSRGSKGKGEEKAMASDKKKRKTKPSASSASARAASSEGKGERAERSAGERGRSGARGGAEATSRAAARADPDAEPPPAEAEPERVPLGTTLAWMVVVVAFALLALALLARLPALE